MRVALLYIIIVLSCFTTEAQVNLLANGSFELQSSCPDSYYQLERALYWDTPNRRNYGGPQCICVTLYDSCASSFNINVPNNLAGGGFAQDGNAYPGFYPIHFFYDTLHLKNYLQSEIATPLKTNTYYCFKMYIKLANYCDWAINDFSVYFSTTHLRDSLSLALDYLTPQIINNNGQYYTNRNNWEVYTGYFKADGGEKYLTIGSFLPIDSTPLTPVVGQFDAAYYFIDNVQLYECDSVVSLYEKPTSPINIYPNPSNGIFTIESPKPIKHLKIYSSYGQLVYEAPLSQSHPTINVGMQAPQGGGTLNNTTIDLSHLSKGMYVFVVQSGDRVWRKLITKN